MSGRELGAGDRTPLSSDETFMALAIEQAELARGRTGDNPWVGCVIVSASGQVLGCGYTRGPGEHHAEISAAADAAAHGHSIIGATLYSTLEPCSFHGRTPACAHSIVQRGLSRVVIGIRDPNPRVDGAGIAILQAGGVEVVEGVAAPDVELQLGSWILQHHPQSIRRAASALAALSKPEQVTTLATRYGVEPATLAAILP